MSEHQERCGEVESGSFAKKQACPVTLAEFISSAAPLSITLDGQQLLAPARSFATGSFGWHLSRRMRIKVNGKDVNVSCAILCTVSGSRNAARE